ncbi:hypothetical protein IW261DRAFT_822736 [Armillaria novae-zelandiae]|uniref:F-box domain-containing protein n=1 Tax=Armillaria novae-zelandiae TaxID=153914 RepID=A0AA39NUE9_9AGAR|nr:hypothetical protein IW261DRAFT_822736 [Armillaria novae-zelandiae]
MLLQLPVELLLKISELLNNESQRNLRLVCRLLNDATMELIFADFKINATEDALLSNRAMLKALATRTTDIWRYVKVLRLVQSPRLGPPVKSVEMAPKSRKVVSSGLYKAIASLENVTTVDWFSVKPVHDTITGAVISSICRLPSLQTFVLYMSNRMHRQLPRFHLKNLASMDLSFSGPSWDGFLRDSLPGILENCPDLSFLALADHTRGPATTLGSLFQNLRRPLRLKSLVLSKIRVPPSIILVPHFQFLTVLGVAPSGMFPPKFWSGLSDVHLHSVNVDDINTELLDYLLSYTGVEEFRFQVPEDNAEYDKLGTKFFSQVLPHHSATLKILSIQPAFEGMWSFQESTMLPILQCRNLVTLWVSLRFSDISNPTEPGIVVSLSPTFIYQAFSHFFYQAYLLHSLKLLPDLSDLYLECPMSFSPRFPPTNDNRWKGKHMLGQAIEAVNTIPNQDPYRTLQIMVEPFGGKYTAHWNADSDFSAFYAETLYTDGMIMLPLDI